MNDNLLIASLPPAARPGASPVAVARLVRIELRRNPMIAMLPLAVALFWYQAYRHVVALPPLWNVRAMTIQNDALLDFAMPVTGAAAWLGWREHRRQLSELLAGTPRQAWTRRLAAWAAATCWALAGYLACVAVVYGITARQATWGGPLWWPAVVGAAGIPALTAFGFVAGVMAPSRFTAPLVTIAAFFGLGYSSSLANGGHATYWLISPLLAGASGIGADPGIATFYRYLPDLSIAQVMFLAGITLALLGVLGLPSRPWRIRTSAAMLAAAGLAAAGTALGLAGTARLDPHGMTVIPALHDAASDRPAAYTPACGGTGIVICVHPAYAAYLPDVTGTLEPMLRAVAGLPGAPASLHQAPQVYEQGPGNAINLPAAGPGPKFLLPPLPATRGATGGTDFAAQLEAGVAVPVVTGILGVQPDGPATPAQQAIVSALTHVPYAQARELGIQPGLLALPGSPAAAAAQRFAALPVAAQHAWLAAHLSALQAGKTSLAQLP